MFSKAVKSFLFFFSVTLLLSVLAFLNFYQLIPPEASVGIIIFVVTAFYRRERINDQLHYEFATIVTHKIRTPLTGIRWALQILSDETITLQERQDLIKQMQNASDRLTETIDLLVGFVKFDKKLEYAYEATFIREMVDVSIQKYAELIRQKNIKFDIEPGKNIAAVIIDRRKIQFAVDMLVDNAIKYTPVDGLITISFIQDKKSITLRIKDTGIGIASKDKGKIFKRFFRTATAKTIDTEGMGLGLYTVKKIIDHHKGKIWVESEGEGKGATFSIRFLLR